MTLVMYAVVYTTVAVAFALVLMKEADAKSDLALFIHAVLSLCFGMLWPFFLTVEFLAQVTKRMG